jgi:hypothetical protein
MTHQGKQDSAAGMALRIFRSPAARYYAEDILEGPAVYTDACLSDLTAHGFNGIWLRARLRDASRTDVFPELGLHSESYYQALNTLSTRAASHGVGVYLYLNEPLCFPADHAFWTAHPDVRGASGSSGMDDWSHTSALCTSHPTVQAWLRKACADLFGHCPDLAGVFTITASEHHTHCYSHNMGGKTDCPRCASRSVAEVTAEVNNLIHAGISSVAPNARVIAWNWSWSSAGGAGKNEIVARLDPHVAVMADFERGGTKIILGQQRAINEYCLSYVGPSEEFIAVHDLAESKGHAVFAKLQIGTTHEIATVNNIPLIPNLLGKARALRKHGIRGALCCWNFGNRLTLNTWSFNHFINDVDLPATADEQALSDVAREYLGVTDTAPVLNAWSLFVEAFNRYPFHACFVYAAPVNYALVYPLPALDDPDRPLQWTWIPLKKPFGTRLSQSVDHEWGRTGYTLEDVRDAFIDMTRIFAQGLAHYRTALERSTVEPAQRELKNAIVIYHILRSMANIYTAYLLCRKHPFDRTAWRAIADDEKKHLLEIVPLLENEKEIGFHSEASAWFFTADEIKEKIRSLS